MDKEKFRMHNSSDLFLIDHCLLLSSKLSITKKIRDIICMNPFVQFILQEILIVKRRKKKEIL